MVLHKRIFFVWNTHKNKLRLLAHYFNQFHGLPITHSVYSTTVTIKIYNFNFNCPTNFQIAPRINISYIFGKCLILYRQKYILYHPSNFNFSFTNYWTFCTTGLDIAAIVIAVNRQPSCGLRKTLTKNKVWYRVWNLSPQFVRLSPCCCC